MNVSAKYMNELIKRKEYEVSERLISLGRVIHNFPLKF